MKLYYTPNLNPRLAVAVARHLGSPVDFIRARPRDPAHRQAFRPLNPNTLAPVLEENGKTLWEADAIACRLSALAGSDFWRRGGDQPEMIRWVSWATQHLNRAGEAAYFELVVIPTFSPDPPDMEVVARSLAQFREHAEILDEALQGRDWLVGDTVSYADFRTAALLPYSGTVDWPVQDLANIRRWHDRLWDLPAWRDPFAGLVMDAA